MFSDSKVTALETKLDIYEELSREMLAKLESAVDKISEGNARIAQILAKHDERIEQSIKSDDPVSYTHLTLQDLLLDVILS